MSPRTIFLSRLIGLYCIVFALSMMTRRQATVETVTVLLQNPSMTLILGVITLAAGLAMVLAHNIWSGGALVVVVTLLGWMALIKSLFFLFLPPEMEAGAFSSAASLSTTLLPVRSYLARPRRLPDLLWIPVKVTLKSRIQMPFSLTIATSLLDIGAKWTLSASLATLSSCRKCSKRRILGHSAQATSLLPIEGTTKCSRIAHGSGSGSISGFAAEPSPQ